MSENALTSNLEIREANGVPVVNSRAVARCFGKEHRNVLRDIGEIIHRSDLSDVDIAWFFETQTQHPTITDRFDRSFDMTRDGFSLLVMGWTGAKALRFKVAYINEFNRMEAALRQASASPTIDVNDPAALRHLLIDYSERVIQLQAENAELAPKAAALVRISKKEGESTLRQASKELFGGGNAIFPVLAEIGWLYRSGGKWYGYQTKMPHYLTVREVECRDGQSRSQTLITPTGRAKLAEGLERLRRLGAAVLSGIDPGVVLILRQSGYLPPNSGTALAIAAE
jgi:Rha family phage regulatory protein